MANKYRNEVEVELNGTKYLLRPTFECIAEIEDYLKTGIIRFMGVFTSGQLKIMDAYTIISKGIEAAGGKVDVEVLQRDMSEGGLSSVVSAIDKFLVAATNSGSNIKKN